MASHIETARDSIITKLQAITVANGYNNTVADVAKAIMPIDMVTAWPHLGVELQESTIEMKDDARTVFDEVASVYVAGYVLADTETATDPENVAKLLNKMESLVHDLKKKICTDVLTTNINSSPKWNVELSENKLVFHRTTLLGETRNIGIVSTEFKLRVRSQDSNFS